MYPDLTMAEKMFLSMIRKKYFTKQSCPYSAVPQKNICLSGLCNEEIAPELDKIGVMLPNNPLLYLIAKECNKPLVTTSGNISGSPILYKDEDALTHLFDIADLILTYDREIVMPQDDSVLQLTETGQKIILRRSRGLAPGYFPHPFSGINERLLAFDRELKGSFAIYQNGNIYISQYLGDQQSLESQIAYKNQCPNLLPC